MRAILTRFRRAWRRWREARLRRWADALLRDADFHRRAAAEYTAQGHALHRRADRLQGKPL